MKDGLCATNITTANIHQKDFHTSFVSSFLAGENVRIFDLMLYEAFGLFFVEKIEDDVFLIGNTTFLKQIKTIGSETIQVFERFKPLECIKFNSMNGISLSSNGDFSTSSG